MQCCRVVVRGTQDLRQLVRTELARSTRAVREGCETDVGHSATVLIDGNARSVPRELGNTACSLATPQRSNVWSGVREGSRRSRLMSGVKRLTEAL